MVESDARIKWLKWYFDRPILHLKAKYKDFDSEDDQKQISRSITTYFGFVNVGVIVENKSIGPMLNRTIHTGNSKI